MYNATYLRHLRKNFSKTAFLRRLGGERLYIAGGRVCSESETQCPNRVPSRGNPQMPQIRLKMPFVYVGEKPKSIMGFLGWNAFPVFYLQIEDVRTKILVEHKPLKHYQKQAFWIMFANYLQMSKPFRSFAS